MRRGACASRQEMMTRINLANPQELLELPGIHQAAGDAIDRHGAVSVEGDRNEVRLAAHLTVLGQCVSPPTMRIDGERVFFAAESAIVRVIVPPCRQASDLVGGL